MFISFIVPEAFICGYFQTYISLTDEQTDLRLKIVVLTLGLYCETVISTVFVLWSACILQVLQYYETMLVLFPMRNGEDPKHYHNLLPNEISPQIMSRWCVTLSLFVSEISVFFLVVEGLWFKFLLQVFIFPWFSLEMMCWPPGYCPSIHTPVLYFWICRKSYTFGKPEGKLIYK